MAPTVFCGPRTHIGGRVIYRQLFGDRPRQYGPIGSSQVTSSSLPRGFYNLTDGRNDHLWLSPVNRMATAFGDNLFAPG